MEEGTDALSGEGLLSASSTSDLRRAMSGLAYKGCSPFTRAPPSLHNTHPKNPTSKHPLELNFNMSLECIPGRTKQHNCETVLYLWRLRRRGHSVPYAVYARRGGE